MYANKQNVLELVALMLEFGIKDIVLCPGSRNSPLTQGFATNPQFNSYSITDERSAAFFALGLTQALKKPVAICCTSGSALLNVLPAVSEAYYQQLPLLVISADRPIEWIGQMDGQTLPQTNMGSVIFKKSVHLPEVKDDSEYWHCNRLINEALLALTHRSNGPVHINIPLSEPLFDFSVKELPSVRKINRVKTAQPGFTLSEQLLEQWTKATRPLIIVGQQYSSSEIDEALAKLSKEKGCVVLAENISNIQSVDKISNFDSILHVHSEDDSLKPDLVIYFGGHIVSKRLKAYIRKNKPNHQWFITPEGEVIDTFQCLTSVVEANILPFLQALLRIEKVFDVAYSQTWIKLSKEIEDRSQKYHYSNFSDIAVMKQVIESLPVCKLQLGNSSIIRNAQLFTSKNVQEALCNRGTSGIEGSVSTAVGFSTGYDGVTSLVVGDLSFFYDMNSLWNQYVSPKLRILVLNNGNGQIFNVLPSLEKSEIRSKFIAASHKASVKAWVEDRGCKYLSANNQSELTEALNEFTLEKADMPIVLEVFTDAELSENDFKEYYKYLKI